MRYEYSTYIKQAINYCALCVRVFYSYVQYSHVLTLRIPRRNVAFLRIFYYKRCVYSILCICIQFVYIVLLQTVLIAKYKSTL